MSIYEIDRAGVLQLSEDGYVERSLSEKLLKSSVYWYEHPSGYPVHAPGHVKRISSREANRKGTTSNDWCVEFGANAFSISRAVSRCQKVLLDFLDKQFSRYVYMGDASEVEKSLHEKVRQSVENFDGYEYGLYPVNPENHMMFGASSISVGEFIAALLAKCQTSTNVGVGLTCLRCKKDFNNMRELRDHVQRAHNGMWKGM
jgi:hypothetical protein